MPRDPSKCSYENCDRPSEWECDDCGRWFCEEHVDTIESMTLCHNCYRNKEAYGDWVDEDEP